MLAWATGVWEGTPDLDSMQAALRGSVARLSPPKRLWCGATNAAATFVLTLLRLGWSAQSARHFTTHNGTKIDLLAVAPKTVGFWVDQASFMWSDSCAHWNTSKGRFSGKPSGPLLVAGKLEHRIGLRGSGDGKTTDVSFATTAQAQCSIATTSARLCRPSGTLTSHRRCGRRRGPFSHKAGNISHMAFSPVLPQSCQLVHSRIHAPPYGAVPCDVLLGQTSRDGEDYAAAMAGIITMDPLTLHIDCARTIASVVGPKCKALGAGSPRAHVWSRLLVSHQEVRARSRATPTYATWTRTCHLFKRRNDYADTFAKKGADTQACFSGCEDSRLGHASCAMAEAHVLLRFAEFDDTRAAAPRARLGHVTYDNL